VGRSRPFWTFFQPTFASTFPAFSGIPAETLYRAANVVKPSLIRVEADEVTYNLHIMLRFELEEGLITGKISAGDLPDLWRDAMDRYLGVVPEEDADGVLQDVHWSSGLFGYFPSYMLGNLYSSQIFACVQKEIPDLDTHFARGDFAPLLTWLRERVHRFGMIYEPKDLVKRITGEDPDVSYFVRYIEEKYSQIYKL
ncbi:carboxypeptidase M32, partial [Candidatus Bipolaricaulota bacterium]|nr:carboxypeptidase M32 [Candidatus Bipolaricaulota bacterium]